MSAAEPAGDGSRPNATSPLRQVVYALVLVAAAFSQSGGRMVADTKFDLLTDPGGFLQRGIRLWDPLAAFGQLQNQAYGYIWPMGPFFWLGHVVHFPEWAVQRAWWALLLCLAFFGILRLAKALQIGTPTTQVIAAFAFVLTPRFSSLLGAVSIEIWPTAIAPWVLLPLIRGAEKGSVRRAAALSALAVACCGGVNAVAVAAVLPLGVIWIVTRAPGPRRWRLLGWWAGLTALATAWWWGPLLVLGRYSVPFLDYIESAAVTTAPTSQIRTLLGVSDWIAYLGGQDYPAGRMFLDERFLLLDAALVVALGVLGIGMRRVPQQRFLVLGLLTGVALVGLGFTGHLDGFFAADRKAALDGALAPLRNVHKFDVVLRIPLVLGMAHALAQLRRLLPARQGVVFGRFVTGTVAIVLIGLTAPWFADRIAPANGVDTVPSYWPQTARYLARQSPSGTALVLPASSFGVYTWGNVHDDIMQGYARSRWATRNVIPLAQPGNVDLLDAITRVVESGRPDPDLARFLAANGVTELVVRNDLDRLKTGAPDPVLVHSALTETPGLVLARSFGPSSNKYQWRYADDGTTRLVFDGGIDTPLHAVDVYRVDASVNPPADATLTQGFAGLVGDPGSPTSAALDGLPAGSYLLGSDGSGHDDGQVLTDGLRRRESLFSQVRDNVSATMAADEPYRLGGPEHTRRLYDDQARWESTVTWSGDVAGVRASSSQAYADAQWPLRVDSAPDAALDGDPATAWRSDRAEPANGQWWEADLAEHDAVATVSVRLASDSAPVPKLRISAGGASRTVDAPEPGERGTWRVDLPSSDHLRVEAVGPGFGAFAIAEVGMQVGTARDSTDLTARRLVRLPDPVPGVPVDRVALTRDPDQLPCRLVEASFQCLPILQQSGDDGDTLARTFSVTGTDDYRVTAMGSLRRTAAAGDAVQRLLGVRVTTPDQTSTTDIAASPLAMVDDDNSTTWISARSRPVIRVRLARTVSLRSIGFSVNDGAPAALPARVRVRAPDHPAVVVDVDDDGRVALPGWRTRDFTITVEKRAPVFDVSGNDVQQVLPGISELTVNDALPARVRSGRLDLPCGQGPTIDIGGLQRRTSVSAPLVDLIHGAQVPLAVCGTGAGETGPVSLSTSPTDLVALPTATMRVDAVRLDRVGALVTPVRTVHVGRSADGTPRHARLGARPSAGVLTLPQNLNAGWVATVGGHRLTPIRVDGWKQGWIVPAGSATTVRFEFAPGSAFTAWLVAGLDGLLVVVLVALLGRRSEREDLPALGTGGPGLLDVAVVVVVAGMLGGWVALGVVAAVAVALCAGVVRRADWIWGPTAAVGVLLATLSLTWDRIATSAIAETWGQAWCLVVVGALTGALVVGSQRVTEGRFFARRIGRSKNR